MATEDTAQFSFSLCRCRSAGFILSVRAVCTVVVPVKSLAPMLRAALARVQLPRVARVVPARHASSNEGAVNQSGGAFRDREHALENQVRPCALDFAGVRGELCVHGTLG